MIPSSSSSPRGCQRDGGAQCATGWRRIPGPASSAQVAALTAAGRLVSDADRMRSTNIVASAESANSPTVARTSVLPATRATTASVSGSAVTDERVASPQQQTRASFRGGEAPSSSAVVTTLPGASSRYTESCTVMPWPTITELPPRLSSSASRALESSSALTTGRPSAVESRYSCSVSVGLRQTTVAAGFGRRLVG